MTDLIIFLVDGNPVPKQSTRFDGRGHAHTDPRVKAWQDIVSLRAKEAMQTREIIKGQVAVRLVFVLKTHRPMDCDNLSKGVLDAIKNIVFEDDSEVFNLHIVKHVIPKANPGVMVEVRAGELLPPFVREK